MLRRAALLCLLPSVALAQTAAIGRVTITESDTDGFVNLDECTGTKADNLILNWQVGLNGSPPTTVPSGTTVSLTISTDGNCPPPSTATVWQPATAPDAAGSASGSYPPSGTLAVTTVLSALQLGTCPSQQKPLNACAAMNIGGTTYSATGTITLDTQVPPAPTLDGVAPGDSALIASYTVGTTSTSTPAATDHYQAVATGPDSQDHVSTSTNSTSARIDGLANGVAYSVVVYAYNKAGNKSAASNTVAGTPQPVIDFWEAYKSGGGREQGGCGAGSAGDVAPILAAAALALALRRRLS